MAYEKQIWVDETGAGDGTVFTASRMNHIENGIEAAGEGGGAAAVWIDTEEPTDPEANLWIDTDEPGVDLSDWAGLDARVESLETTAVSLDSRLDVVEPKIVVMEAAPVWTDIVLNVGTHYYPCKWSRANDTFGTVRLQGEIQMAGIGADGALFNIPGAINRPPIRTYVMLAPNVDAYPRLGYAGADGWVRCVGVLGACVMNIGAVTWPTR